MKYPERPSFHYWGDFNSEENQKIYRTWVKENSNVLEERHNRDNEYAFSFFSRSNLSGCILQFAFKAIELFSSRGNTPPELAHLIKKYNAEKFCIGRIVDNLPIGLIVYAGRNQSVHFNNLSNKLNIEIFNKIAHWYSERFNKWYINSYYDLKNEDLIHYGENILFKLEWFSYEKYEQDIKEMLETAI